MLKDFSHQVFNVEKRALSFQNLISLVFLHLI